MRQFVFSMIAAALAAPAMADCLTANDAEGGIRVSFQNGDVTTVRALGADMFQIEETYAEGTQHFRFHALYSTYNLWDARLIGGVQQDADAIRIDWGVDLSELPRPAADAPAWTGEVIEYDPSGGINERGQRELRFAPGKPIVLGDCSYETLTVGAETNWTINPRVQVQFWSYLPELGISFVVGWTNSANEYVETSVTNMEAM